MSIRPIVIAALLLQACATEKVAPTEADETAAQEQDLTASGSPKWIYNGLMPALESAQVTVSLKGHTARVTGLLKPGFTGKLPWYATTAPEGARTRVTVVYPVATGALATSNGPGNYLQVFASPYVATTVKAPWGGFPFMAYNNQRGLAFHGPITQEDGQWHLLRGPVSHGCNRMQGEHVVELAQIFGIDMRRPRTSSDHLTLAIKVDVIGDYDQFQGKMVDVDYPTQPQVVRPKGVNVQLFPTWDSLDQLATVCAWNPKLWSADPTKNVTHCSYAGKNKFDPLTGKAL